MARTAKEITVQIVESVEEINNEGEKKTSVKMGMDEMKKRYQKVSRKVQTTAQRFPLESYEVQTIAQCFFN